MLLHYLLFQDKQGGNIGLVVDCEWAEANSDKIEDKSAAARRLDFQIGWYCLKYSVNVISLNSLINGVVWIIWCKNKTIVRQVWFFKLQIIPSLLFYNANIYIWAGGTSPFCFPLKKKKKKLIHCRILWIFGGNVIIWKCVHLLSLSLSLSCMHRGHAIQIQKCAWQIKHPQSWSENDSHNFSVAVKRDSSI